MAGSPVDNTPPPRYKKPKRRQRSPVEEPNDGDPRPPTSTSSDDASGQPSEDKPLANHTYGPQRTFVGAVLIFSNILVFCLLAALVFASPDQMSGATAVLKNAQGEYVGVLRKCSGGTCDPWMGGGGTADSGDTSAFSLPDMFLTLGLAALSALWLAIYILLFTAVRIFTKTPDNASDKPLDGFKRYLYRATRVFLVVNVVLVPSLIIDVVVKANAYRGSEGLTSVVGAGVVPTPTVLLQHCHYVFATSAPYSHAPAAVRLSVGLVTLDSSTRVSITIHANNTPAAEKIMTSAPQARDRIRLWIVGSKGALKDHARAYKEMVFKSGRMYEQILQDTTWAAPSVYLFDITAFWHVQSKAAVEAKFPHLARSRLVGYSPVPLSDMIYLIGSAQNGSTRWVVDAVKARGIDLLHNTLLGADEDEYEKRLAVIKQAVEREDIYREVCFGSDHVCRIPGVPPFHMYEYWSRECALSKALSEGILQNIAGVPTITTAVEGWISWYPSDIVEPGSLDAARSDPYIGRDGEKPVFIAGPYDVTQTDDLTDDDREVEAFLDAHPSQSVVLVSFGTLVDAGSGVNILLEELARSRTPFVFAAGGQLAGLPVTTRLLLGQAKDERRAVAPNWLDLRRALDHPLIMCFVSHCGANSVVEAMHAAVPILAWGRQWDQITNSSQVGARGIGIELVQHREGGGVGRPIAHRDGEILTGDPEACRQEVRQALVRVKGDEGRIIRQTLVELAAEMKLRRVGVWDESIREFILWTKMPFADGRVGVSAR